MIYRQAVLKIENHKIKHDFFRLQYMAICTTSPDNLETILGRLMWWWLRCPHFRFGLELWFKRRRENSSRGDHFEQWRNSDAQKLCQHFQMWTILGVVNVGWENVPYWVTETFISKFKNCVAPTKLLHVWGQLACTWRSSGFGGAIPEADSWPQDRGDSITNSSTSGYNIILVLQLKLNSKAPLNVVSTNSHEHRTIVFQISSIVYHGLLGVFGGVSAVP